MKQAYLFFIITALVYTQFFGCGVIPQEHTGQIDIRLLIHNPPSPSDISRETTWDYLLVQVSADDMDTYCDTFKFDHTQAMHFFSLSNVSSGINRLIEVWTIDKSGDIIHKKDSVFADIDPSQTFTAVFELHPLKGSIYINLSMFPSVVDSVYTAFISADTVWQKKQKKVSKLYMSLDKIPFNTVGTIAIVGYSANGDTVAAWQQDNFNFKNALTTINANFIDIGTVSVTVTVIIPGVTIVNGIMDTTDSLGEEKGGLILSEIMFSANDSEYIELYNPSDTLFHDTIIVQIDNGTFRYFVPSIKPKEFYVIGRNSDLPWCDTFPSTGSALDLSSSSGNWITVRAKDLSIMDLVIFQAGTNEQEWPSKLKKQSLILDSLSCEPRYNNFARHWKPAQSLINPTVTQQRGTPGKEGF